MTDHATSYKYPWYKRLWDWILGRRSIVVYWYQADSPRKGGILTDATVNTDLGVFHYKINARPGEFSLAWDGTELLCCGQSPETRLST